MLVSKRSITTQIINLKGKYHCGNHKRTWQGVPTVLLSYLYKSSMVHANDKLPYPNIYASSISLPHVFYKDTMPYTYALMSLL